MRTRENLQAEGLRKGRSGGVQRRLVGDRRSQDGGCGPCAPTGQGQLWVKPECVGSSFRWSREEAPAPAQPGVGRGFWKVGSLWPYWD